MWHEPANSLRNRSFVGLIIAQFLAGFNDQAIHAAAMFYAFHRGILNEATAISLMPILFYAPWAIFCTLSGYLADRYSKRYALVTWKVAEVGIALVAVLGFWLGSVEQLTLGPWLVLGCVFLMGTHAAFFAPAKYGAMPEILQPHVLSRGNGILESTTFLAAILGTVTGGLLSQVFDGREQYIGLVLLVLAAIGAVASFLIAPLPPANPQRPFPVNLFKPLAANLRVLLRARPLALAVLGIAFFVFMVSYMRATMYMHGQTRNPPWRELQVSLVVATVALGVGLGSPLAGFLSGGKVELGLVPVGTLGMIAATLVAALAMQWTEALIVSLILIGFFSGFYMVPLYTLLQHRAPKASKGDMVATSNFINVTGAIAASVLFFLLVLGAKVSGLTPEVPQQDRFAQGKIKDVQLEPHTRKPIEVKLTQGNGKYMVFRARTTGPVAVPTPPNPLEDPSATEEEVEAWIYKMLAGDEELEVIDDFDENFLEVAGAGQGSKAIVSRYELRGVIHYHIRLADQPLRTVYDNERLPRFLFLGAALMTAGILVLLVRQLPDFFLRSLIWLRCLGRYRLKVIGTHHLPMQGSAILATNCHSFDAALQVLAALDRDAQFIVVSDDSSARPRGLLGWLVNRSGLVTLRQGASAAEVAAAAQTGRAALVQQRLLVVSAEGPALLLLQLAEANVPLLPVYCGALSGSAEDRAKIGVVIGQPLLPPFSTPVVQRTLQVLGGPWPKI